jgi:FkbM family methyltransferase
MRISLKHWLRRRRSPWLQVFYDSFKLYKKDRREGIRQDFIGLNENSIVLDFGGFEGNWAHDIYERYKCSVHVFEPHPRFAEALRARFSDNEKIVIHEYALGTVEGTLNLTDDGDASSALRENENAVLGQVIPVSEFVTQYPDTEFALAKINIEGGEYDLLPALIGTGLITKIRILQVQFHLYSEDLIAVRKDLVSKIEQSHSSDWSYPFVWEQWTKK